jgi:hypothetical protein
MCNPHQGRDLRVTAREHKSSCPMRRRGILLHRIAASLFFPLLWMFCELPASADVDDEIDRITTGIAPMEPTSWPAGATIASPPLPWSILPRAIVAPGAILESDRPLQRSHAEAPQPLLVLEEAAGAKRVQGVNYAYFGIRHQYLS